MEYLEKLLNDDLPDKMDQRAHFFNRCINDLIGIILPEQGFKDEQADAHYLLAVSSLESASCNLTISAILERKANE